MAAYLARFKGSSREHTESDLRCYLSWCAERGLDPLVLCLQLRQAPFHVAVWSFAAGQNRVRGRCYRADHD